MDLRRSRRTRSPIRSPLSRDLGVLTRHERGFHLFQRPFCLLSPSCLGKTLSLSPANDAVPASNRQFAHQATTSFDCCSSAFCAGVWAGSFSLTTRWPRRANPTSRSRVAQPSRVPTVAVLSRPSPSSWRVLAHAIATWKLHSRIKRFFRRWNSPSPCRESADVFTKQFEIGLVRE